MKDMKFLNENSSLLYEKEDDFLVFLRASGGSREPIERTFLFLLAGDILSTLSFVGLVLDHASLEEELITTDMGMFPLTMGGLYKVLLFSLLLLP